MWVCLHRLIEARVTVVCMKRTISTEDAPAAVGAYSQATTDGSTLYTAGQIPLTPDGELLADRSVAEQTAQALDNVVAILESEGLDASAILKTTVFWLTSKSSRR